MTGSVSHIAQYYSSVARERRCYSVKDHLTMMIGFLLHLLELDDSSRIPKLVHTTT